ncbi:amastin-like protein [Leptomonas pyrrhocoris]|uniref:Amastin-like protein n=1 Tax=Leptomonas pyrrhocoris TaxID=157538 RepID=A0A0N0DWS4_LEPPY|nr:amastin-like protein [Leptomonas pyrrhocoris]XP_015660570.1 amastin-like protein [Leptomonas pyrrhocoris]XP_015660571.1 amastin-like protein [Leptomonas pyrrhocoris]KPA82130.1 amastin-like protein [Leptomonas pyrrhocoris]KPA82131.1 amastin-like protein [Leptomonas pyrrhocoris]KPA82132.1 amastin-like protein [Leptomonas pyrrhocoris]|eukprot:XP_015660569.1 amastin-like protein [Leptomonas pyrrhocoris]
MGVKVGIVIYCILQFIAFLFLLVGTPIDMFRAKNEDTIGNKPCLTMWGTKEKCYSTKYDIRPDDLFVLCKERRDRFRAAEAFAIIHIVVYLVACILGFVQLCCCSCLRWACLALNILGITSCISWAIMADLYLRNSSASLTWSGSPNCYKFNLAFKYGAGFGLLVTAWCLNIVAMVFLMLPC